MATARTIPGQLERLIAVAREISSQSDYPDLFRMVVNEAMQTLGAEGGTLYLFDTSHNTLEAVVVVNDALDIAHSIYRFVPNAVHGMFRIKLPDDDKQPSKTVAGACWQRRSLVVVPDIPSEKSYDMSGVIAFDKENGYKTRNIVAVPLLARDGTVLGVVQLVNARDGRLEGAGLSFIEAVAASMGMALEISLLLKGTEDLLYSVVSMISKAIDRRSETTGGHCSRVTDLTMLFVEELAQDPNHPFGALDLGEDQLAAIRVAAQLHDVGKIATPDHVLDKGRKLEKVYDRIGLVEERFRLRKSEMRVAQLERAFREAKLDLPQAPDDEDDDLEFVKRMNGGGEALSKEDAKRLRELAERSSGGSTLLSKDELSNLLVERGTLTPEERKIMEDHVRISIELLAEMPWPHKMSSVPDIAGKHHESLNGSGYPLGLKADSMSIPARILAIVDRFEGLSAVDRPYRARKKLSQVLAIMERMRSGGEIDSDLYDYFIDRKLHLAYARSHMPPELIDVS